MRCDNYCCICLAFVQQVGRAGRDGLMARSTTYYNNEDICQPKSGTGIDSALREFCITVGCRRQLLCSQFDEHCVELVNLACCDNCGLSDADNEHVNISSLFREYDFMNNSMHAAVAQRLQAYFCEQNYRELCGELTTGLDKALLNKILESLICKDDLDLLCDRFPYVDAEYMAFICNILQDLK